MISPDQPHEYSINECFSVPNSEDSIAQECEKTVPKMGTIFFLLFMICNDGDYSLLKNYLFLLLFCFVSKGSIDECC